MPYEEIVVDTCALLNLLATGLEAEIVTALRLRLVMGKRGHQEVRTLRTLPDENDERAVIPANTLQLREAGLLRITNVEESNATDAFVNCVARLRDEDAEAVALATVLRLPLVTDDGHARKVAGKLYPATELRTSLGMVRAFVNHAGLDKRSTVAIALNLRWRGNFAPPLADPDSSWFSDLLAG